MIYETKIKIKNTYLVSIEFDTETEEFSYQVKTLAEAKEKTKVEKQDKQETKIETEEEFL